MKKVNVLAVLSALCLFAAMPSYAVDPLTTWNKTVSASFDPKGSLHIPGIPAYKGVWVGPVTVPYPCGPILHMRTCHRTITGGHWIGGTPAIGGITHELSSNLGSISATVNGGVYPSSSSKTVEVELQNSLSVDMFNHKVTYPVSCKIKVGNSAKICQDVFTGKLSGTGASAECTLGTKSGNIPAPKGTTAKVCFDMTVNSHGDAAVTGSGDIKLESSINLGTASGFGHTISLGSRSWNPLIYKLGF